MKNTMGIILTGGKNNRLKELSGMRAISAVPVAGKYRAIDFVLSNMVNSGITNIGMLAQYSFHSLMDHLGSGKEWDLDRKNNGLYIFPPFQDESGKGWYLGTADAMYNNLSFLKRSDEEFVLIAQGNCVYNMSFEPLLERHLETGADVTVACRYMHDFSTEELSLLGIIEKDQNGKIIDFQEKPLTPKTKLASIGIYIIKRKLLISLLEESAAHARYDFVKDILVQKYHELNMQTYIFNGYWRSMSSIQLFYNCNMDMLNPTITRELFGKHGKIYTKVKDETPAKYNEEANVKNSIVADGCIIEGDVSNCVLFRGVRVKKGAILNNCIVMQDSIIDENAYLEYSILDKNVNITCNKQLRGEVNWPIIVSKGVTV